MNLQHWNSRVGHSPCHKDEIKRLAIDFEKAIQDALHPTTKEYLRNKELLHAAIKILRLRIATDWLNLDFPLTTFSDLFTDEVAFLNEKVVKSNWKSVLDTYAWNQPREATSDWILEDLQQRLLVHALQTGEFLNTQLRLKREMLNAHKQ